MTDTMREEFEAWAKERHPLADFVWNDDGPPHMMYQGKYYGSLADAWLAWQAALAAFRAAEVATGPSEEEVAKAIQREVIEQMPDLNEPIAKAAARVACAMLRGKA